MEVLRRIRQDRCAHRVTMTVKSAGIERVVCEACGHVSVHFLSDLSGEVDRDRFARSIEREGRHQRADEEREQSLADAISDTGSPGHPIRSSVASLWREPEPEPDF
ncbi:MAG: hypothetical protein ACRDZM_15540 [Acidimicrobiia bacterium]